VSTANEAKIKKAEQTLNLLLDRTHSAIHDTTSVIDRIRNSSAMLKELEGIGEKAHRANIFDVPSVTGKYSSAITKVLESTTAS
jgi:hypothetical protein